MLSSELTSTPSCYVPSVAVVIVVVVVVVLISLEAPFAEINSLSRSGCMYVCRERRSGR